MKRTRALVVLIGIVLVALFGASRRTTSHAEPGKHRPRSRDAGQHAARPSTSAKKGAPLPSASPFHDPDACRAALAHAGARRPAGVARLGAWNLHWFPDGRPGKSPKGPGTDVKWLACAVAFLGVDVLAIEEIKPGARPSQALSALRAELDLITGGRFEVVLDDCPRASQQHVGLLFDARRARLLGSATVGALNPHGEPCKDQLRPGLAARFAFPGGLDLAVIAVHLKSGTDRRALSLREKSLNSFADAVSAARALGGDDDVLVIGDMNSMGCPRCSPSVSALEELAEADRTLAARSPALRRLDAAPACSHFYEGRTTLLDWAAASDLGELPSGRKLVVSGYCAELGCSGGHPPERDVERLSDHCPIYVDIDDVNRPKRFAPAP